MKPDISPTLRRILVDTRTEIARDKARQDATELKAKVRDAIPVLSFASALSAGNAIIAELKEKSPSQGEMRPQNVADAPEEYKRSPIVKAISVLTSSTNFGAGMTMERLAATKQQISKPVLRKDFIIEEYQIYQARAYGADLVLEIEGVRGWSVATITRACGVSSRGVTVAGAGAFCACRPGDTSKASTIVS